MTIAVVLFFYNSKQIIPVKSKFSNCSLCTNIQELNCSRNWEWSNGSDL